MFTIDEEPLHECPVSAIDARAKETVAQLQRVKFLGSSTGGSFYGQDLSMWPAAIAEATISMTSEENNIANARAKAESVHAGSRKAQDD